MGGVFGVRGSRVVCTDDRRKRLKRYNTPGHAHFLTFSCHERRPYLRDPKACEIFLSEIRRARDEHSFRVWAYVLMPDHVHLLIWPTQNAYSIARILNDAKGRMSKQYRDIVMQQRPQDFAQYTVSARGRKIFRFWLPGGGFDRNVWNARAVHGTIRYIELNPVKKRLVLKAEEYPWSSAYAGAGSVLLPTDRCSVPLAW